MNEDARGIAKSSLGLAVPTAESQPICQMHSVRVRQQMACPACQRVDVSCGMREIKKRTVT